MSLATRCSACGTAFRVVQDQLKVSEGWVRCGRCGEVFNAIEGLFDLDRDPPAPAPAHAPVQAPAHFSGAPLAPSAAHMPVPASSAASHVASPAAEPGGPGAAASGPSGSPEDAALAPAARFLVAPDARVAQAPASSPDDEDAATAYEVLDSRFLDQSTYRPERHRERGSDDFADARFDSDLPADEDSAAASPPAAAPGAGAEGADTRSRRPRRRSKVRTVSDATPEFLRRAERAERWKRPAVRALLAGSAVVLLLGLAGQVVFHFRDAWAARQPALAPWLAEGCRWVGCQLGAPRRIDDVVVDSSSLTRLAAIDGYRLTVLVRNRGDGPLATPWIELNLTDADGRLVARRSLDPVAFRAATTLAPRQDATLTLEFTTPGHRIAGYTVEAFYP